MTPLSIVLMIFGFLSLEALSEKKSKVLSPKDLKTVAYHEAGHAVTGWFLQHTIRELHEVSIIPSSKGAGYSQYKHQDSQVFSDEQYFDEMCMNLSTPCWSAPLAMERTPSTLIFSISF